MIGRTYLERGQPVDLSDDPPRCTKTNNPCGTDTVMAGQQCPDSRWGHRCAHQIASRVVRPFRGLRKTEETGDA